MAPRPKHQDDNERGYGPRAHTVYPFRREDIEQSIALALKDPVMIGQGWVLAWQTDYLLFVLDKLGWDGTAHPERSGE